MGLLFSISPSPPINSTRTLSLLSRAQVGFLNALLSGAAQSSHALSPFLVGLATKRSHRAVVGAPAAGGMRSNPRPHSSCQLETGCLWSRGSKSAAWRDLCLRCQPPVQLCRGDRGPGGPVPHPALCPQQGAVSAVGWLAVGLRGERRERGDRTRGWLWVRSLCCSLRNWNWPQQWQAGVSRGCGTGALHSDSEHT